ncbi:hypothetical protein MYRNA_270 [Mycobacterium phage Myrna]|uniref:Uncharacterized protein n=1 Tax=Mycobacterium phage Myrna TaxID=546805 RepID=B5LJP0_9CAUD|nr:gp270 [Mycobacterium phage Myrna]ACH62237.1 hypothetical protein MYRNA_270 [Mycobacterium phage Myrna]
MAFGLPDVSKELNSFMTTLERIANSLDRIETKLDANLKALQEK